MIRKFKMYENLRKGFLGFHRYFRRRKDVTQCGKINMIRNTLLVLYQRVRISISTTFVYTGCVSIGFRLKYFMIGGFMKLIKKQTKTSSFKK